MIAPGWTEVGAADSLGRRCLVDEPATTGLGWVAGSWWSLEIPVLAQVLLS